MTTIACVLKSGGIYTPEWVYALKRGIARHASDYRFVCLTDAAGLPPVWSVSLAYHWPGWWSKLELFRPGVFEDGERVLYLDLDTLVVGDVGELVSHDDGLRGDPGLLQAGAAAVRGDELHGRQR